jgi:gamma-glutamyltranspeptidase
MVPAEANYIKPGKKPLSSMSPTMIFHANPNPSGENAVTEANLGDLRLVIGGSGGPKIITAVYQVIVNYLLLGKPLFEAVAHPRVHNQLIYHGAAATTLENSVVHPVDVNLQVSNRTATALANRGHTLIDIDYAGTVQAVAVDPETGLLTAVCDIRKGGSPVGY